MSQDNLPSAGLGRRLAAMIYDGLLLLAVWFIAAALATLVVSDHRITANNPFYTLYMLLVAIGFFGWFWTHGGQTLGMRSWRLRVQTPEGEGISWRQVVIRCLVAIPALLLAGLGYIGLLWDKQGLNWGDRASNTRVVVLPKKARK